jgi:hypothetical protein
MTGKVEKERPSKEELEAMYTRTRSAGAVGRELGRDESTIRRWLREADIPINKAGGWHDHPQVWDHPWRNVGTYRPDRRLVSYDLKREEVPGGG